MGSHAIDSPSALSRRRLCPASRRIEQEYGVESTSDAAREGTHTHWLIEYCLTEGKQPEDLVGQHMEDDEGVFEVDPERAARARLMVDYVRQRQAEMGGAQMHVEVQVDPGSALGRIDMWGTADVVLVSRDEIEVIDYKDGFIHVSPHDNDQTRAYLLGAVNRFGLYTGLKTTIVQPRNAEQGFEPVGSDQLSGAELRTWMEAVKQDLKESDREGAEAVPGEVQCLWCSAKGACRARAEAALDGIEFPAIPVDPGMGLGDKPQRVAEGMGAMDLSLITDAELERMLPYTGLVREVMKSLEEEAQRRLKAGRTLGRWWLKKTYGHRAWIEPEAVVVKRLQTRGYKKADMYDQKLKSPTQILKKKDLDPKHRKYIEDKLVERRESGVKLAGPDEQGESALPKAPVGMFQPVSPQGDLPTFLQQPQLGD